MKKLHVFQVLALVLALVLVLAGCQNASTSSSDSSSGSQSTSDSGSSSDSGSEKLEAVVLEYYMPEKAQPDAEKVWTEINKYVTEKINATVNIHWIETAEYAQKMSAIIGAGQVYDLCASPTSQLPFSINASNGAYAPLDDLLTQYAPDLLKELPDYVLEGGKVNGKIYGVPSYKDNANSFSILWNETMREEVGVDKDKLTSSWKWIGEKYDAFVEFKEKRDAKYPDLANIPVSNQFHDELSIWIGFDEIVKGICTTVGGTDCIKDQGSGEKVFNIYDTPEFVQVCKDARKFVDAGLIAGYQVEFDTDAVLRKAGKVPLNSGQGYVAIDPHKDSPDWVTEMNRSDVAISSTAYLQSAITVVSATSKNPERAVMFMNLQYSDDYIATASRFGIEGVNYNLVKDSLGNDRLDFKGTNNEDPKNRAYYNWYGAQWGNLFHCTLPVGQPDKFFEELRKMNEEAGAFETNLGFVFVQDSVANEIAACAGVIDEYRKPLLQGAFPADQIEAKCAEFVEKMKANGVQKVVDEAQKQLNEWRAANGKSTYQG